MLSRVPAVDPVDALGVCGGAARWARLRALGVSERGFHVTIRSGVARSLPGVVVHQARLVSAEVERHRACTGPLRTALDCARSMPLPDAVCVLDAALRSASVTEYQLVEAAQCARGPGATALRCSVAHIDPRSGSGMESVLRILLLTTAGSIRSQVYIRGVGTVDLVVDGWLVVEADGFEFHSSRRDYRNDRRRGNALAARGYALLRFAYEDVRYRPLEVVAEVERVRRLRPGVV